MPVWPRAAHPESLIHLCRCRVLCPVSPPPAGPVRLSIRVEIAPITDDVRRFAHRAAPAATEYQRVMSGDRVAQYLERYSLPDSLAAARFVAQTTDTVFRRVLCVPMFDESPDFVSALADHPDIGRTLVIVIINAPDGARAQELERTRDLRQRLLASARLCVTSEHAALLQWSTDDTSHQLLLMDHCSPDRTLPDSEGVGLARKLANDAALALWRDGRIESPWLFQTDADASLPPNYFETPDDLCDCAAIHLNFEHTHADGVSLAQRLYDLKLDYYVAGLAFAGSRYAHYSVGSSIVIHAEFYATVRGYSRHSAGEDFYVLNKLAKTGPVAFDRSRTVLLQERRSARVAFGTGPGVAKFSALDAPLTAPAFYSPDCFLALKFWLQFIDHAAATQAGDSSFDARAEFEAYSDGAPDINAIRAALEELGLFNWLEKLIRRNRRTEQARYQQMIGMDALKTLRLIHTLRDAGFGNVDATAAAQWLAAHPADPVRSGRQVDGRLIITQSPII